MKNITIFKRNGYVTSLLAVVMLLGTFSCKKGTFDINQTNPNSPTAVPPGTALAAALTGTANLIYLGAVGGNQDILNNWMGYWTQSGAYTPSNTYVLYQLTSSTGSGNWDVAYNNLSNYHALMTNVGTSSTNANYRAVSLIMTSFVFQRIVDLYGSAPYTTALIPNAQFSYKYDSGDVIYKAIAAKLDTAVALINANPNATALGTSDVMFQGNMAKWVKFANTLKLKILLRQTESSANGSLGSAAVQTALAGYTQASFLGAGEDASINPGYSNAADNQENPLYLDVVATANGSPGINQKYYRANKYSVDFYTNNNDPRLSALYYPNSNGVIQGRVYGSTLGTEANSVISAITAFGLDSKGNYNGPSVSAPIIPATESLFLQAEAIQRGYIAGDVTATFNSAVAESFRLYGVPNASAAATAYTSQVNTITNITASATPLATIITQKWAALNGIDPLESYSDYRRLGIPKVPISVYPGVTVTHIPFRFPYPLSELNYNGGNVPSGGNGTESLTAHIFWMPANADSF